ncbi:C-type lectin domain family 4 member E-like isoform X2 [Sander lucioperca]|uniref:C-type lectin domain family 4 member E-like isoform X2 n=1 Tax=Sander lucioperca TaxID=283035 RepID=UPI00125E513C|nr:C-type lectin domain family 4 member E-like isoform X2 [Sander lucioperca]
MSEAEVLYSDVKFTRERGNTGTASSPAETTYSEVRISKTQPSTGLPDSQQQPVSNGRSKFPSERVALGVVSVLLAAAVIALGLISHKNMELSQSRDAVAKNLTGQQGLQEQYSKVKSCNTVQPTCPNPPDVKMNLFKEPCQKRGGGWELHGGKCYYFSTDRLSWELSRNLCKEQHGDLVKIDSREEQTLLELKLREKMNQDEDKFWIGLTDSETEGTWLWADGSPLDTSLTFWSSGETKTEPEPDNWTGEDPDGEDCVRMGEKGRAPDLKCWFDKSCKEPQRCICEKEATAAHLKCV